MKRPQPLLGTQPLHAPFRRSAASSGFDLVRDEPIPKPGIIAVQIERGVGEVGVFPVALRDGVCSPLAEGLLDKTQHPAGHRDWNPIGSKVKDQREHYFGSDACDRYTAALLRISFSCPGSRMRFFASRSSDASALVRPGVTPSSMSGTFSQHCRHNSEIQKSFAIQLMGGFALMSNRDDIATELHWECFWHGDRASLRTEILKAGKSTEPKAVQSQDHRSRGGGTLIGVISATTDVPDNHLDEPRLMNDCLALDVPAWCLHCATYELPSHSWHTKRWKIICTPYEAFATQDARLRSRRQYL